jgi:quinol monooxygenase YgiN
MIFIVVKFRVRPEFVDSWPDLLAEFTDATRSEAGNLFFEWSRSLDDPACYVLLEAFADADAGVAHVRSEHFQNAMAELAPLVLSVPEIVNVELPDQQGWGRMAELQPS